MLTELVTFHGCAFRALAQPNFATLVGYMIRTLFCRSSDILIGSNMGVLESIKLLVNVFNHHCVRVAAKTCPHRVVVSCNFFQFLLAQDQTLFVKHVRF